MTIKADIIADSVSEQGIRLTTLQLRYPKFIHGDQATPDRWLGSGPGLILDGWALPELHGNFRGWLQYRKMLTGESVPG